MLNARILKEAIDRLGTKTIIKEEKPVNKFKLNLLKLKVKVKSLAEESRIIRKMENNPYDPEQELYLHRIWDVRNESRATQLAIAYMKGKYYAQIEQICKDEPKRNYYIVPRIVSIVQKYHDRNVTKEDILNWVS